MEQHLIHSLRAPRKQRRRIIWLSRRPDGRLRYPRCVRAHLDKILKLSPNALSNEDIEQLKYLQ